MTLSPASIYVGSELSDATTDEAHLEALGWSGAPRAFFCVDNFALAAGRRQNLPEAARGGMIERGFVVGGGVTPDSERSGGTSWSCDNDV